MDTYYKIYEEKGNFKRNMPAKLVKSGGLNEDTDYQAGVSCIIIQNGKILFEIRSSTQVGAGLMDFCSGHVDNDEDVKTAIIRELKEELGIPFEISKKAINLKTYSLTMERNSQRNWHMSFFYLELPRDFQFLIQESEVENIVFLPIKEAFELIRTNNSLTFPYNADMEEMLKKLQALLIK